MKIETVATINVREQWSSIVDKIRREGGAFVVKKYHKPSVAIIDFELFEELEKKLGIELEYVTEEDVT